MIKPIYLRLIKYILFFYVILFLFSLWQRMPHLDDAWLGEQAYWMAKLGYVKSELFRGLIRHEERVLIHHKLLTFQGALLIKVFGFSIYILKSLSLIYFILFSYLYYYYLVVYKKLLTKNEFLFALLILFVNPNIFTFSFVFRPEILIMTYGFLSFIFIEKLLLNPKIQINAFLGGLFAGLCIATHLNGVVFILVGGILLLINKKITQLLLFGLGAIITTAIYFLDFSSQYGLDFWQYQMNNNPTINVAVGSSLFKQFIFNLLNEHQRYFHGSKEIFFSVLFLISLIFSFKWIRNNNKIILNYLFYLVLFLGFLAVHKTSKYSIVILPYFVIVIILSIKHIIDQKNKIKTISIIVIGIIYLLVSTYYNVFLTIENKDIVAENKMIVAKYKIPIESKIIAPMYFIFNEIEKFPHIQSELYYQELKKSDTLIKGEYFLNMAELNDIDYIILSKDYIDCFDFDTILKGKQFINYQVIDKTDNYMVFSKIKK